MVDAADSKSVDSNILRVQVSSSLPIINKALQVARLYFFLRLGFGHYLFEQI